MCMQIFLSVAVHNLVWVLFARFCPCFLAYLLAVLPSIWLLELDRLEAFTSAFASSNVSTTLVAVNGVSPKSHDAHIARR